MESVLIRHTAELDDAVLAAVKKLCQAVFDGRFAESDWEHALGGMHALRWEGDRLIAHAALVARRLLHGGRSLRTGYVEAVAVAPDRHRQGHGTAVMTALHPYLQRGYGMGALRASDAGAALYSGLGWARWTGRTAVLAPDGVTATPEHDGGIFVRPQATRLDPAELLICDWRDGDVW
ncbi:MAG TPA: GNAT family N-acetyltransferase [Pseudonocardia sp.]